MPRRPAARRFHSALVPFVFSLLRRQGKDPGPLERRFLSTRGSDGAPVAEVTLEELGAVLAEAGALSGDPLFGLHCAQAMPRGAYGLLEFALRAAPTGRQALEQLASYGALINPLVRWTLEADAHEVALHHRAPRRGGMGAHGNVFTVARVLRISREMLGDDVRPTRAWFAHAAKACPPELLAVLGCRDVAFGRASSGLAFDVATLERASKEADPALNEALRHHAAAVLPHLADEELYGRARRVVLELLPKGKATLAATAKRLHRSPRTLQRQLGLEGTSFAALLATVRRERAEVLLARGDEPVEAVGRAVGYADPAAFGRAFRAWTGVAPGAWRARRLLVA